MGECYSFMRIYEIARDIGIDIDIDIETHRSLFGRAKNMDYLGIHTHTHAHTHTFSFTLV